MLNQQILHTTVSHQIRHTTPYANAEHDHLSQCANQSAECHNQGGCSKKPPFFASWTISVLNDTRNFWLPATIICKANNGSYLVQVIGSGQYRHAHDHIQEHHPDAVKPDTPNIGDVAPAASTLAPATQVVRLPTAVAPAIPTPAAPAATLQTAKFCLQYAHHNKHRCHPLVLLWIRLVQPLLSYADQLKAESHHPGLLKRYRPGLSLADEPDDTMTQIAPSATAEVLYP